MAFKLSSRLLLTAALAGAFCASPASAQTQDDGVYFYPAKTWSVNKTEGACSIQTEFNNGFKMRMNGGKLWVEKLNINFRQNIFTAGDAYDVSISVPGVKAKTFKAKANGADSLDFNFNKQKAFYQAMRNSSVMDVKLASNEFRFYLTGFAKSAEGFERCMAGGAPEKPKANEEVSRNDTNTPDKNFMDNEAVAMEQQMKAAQESGIVNEGPQPVVQQIPYKETRKLGDAEIGNNQGAGMTPPAVIDTTDTAAKGVAGVKTHKRLSEQLAEQINADPSLVETNNQPIRVKVPEKTPSAPPAAKEMAKDMSSADKPAPQQPTTKPEMKKVPKPDTGMTPDMGAAAETEAAVKPAPMPEAEAPAVKKEEIFFETPAMTPAKPKEVKADTPQAEQIAAVDADIAAAKKMDTAKAEAVPTPMPEPVAKPKTTRHSTPPIKENKQTVKTEADFSTMGNGPSPGETAMVMRDMNELRETVAALKAENIALNTELKSALRESEEERLTISSDNWNLEQATMLYNEAERQNKRMGQELIKERAKCQLEKKELEAMLFDPEVTDQQQLARLAQLEGELAQAKSELAKFRAINGAVTQ